VLASMFQPAFIESLSTAKTPDEILQRISAAQRS